MRTWKIIWNLYRHPEEWRTISWPGHPGKEEPYILHNITKHASVTYDECCSLIYWDNNKYKPVIMLHEWLRFLIRRWYRLAPLTAFLLTGIPR